jgi:hypothetical protein
MRTVAWLLVGAGVLAGGGLEARAQDRKGSVVTLDGLKSQAPADWVEEKTTSQMRYKQFRLPAAQGDKENAELIIFFFGPGGGGSAADNVKRWKGMFEPPAGKKIDDVAKVEKRKVGDVDVTYLDVQGTYLFKAQPFNPNSPTTPRPNYRMLGIVFESKNGPYFMRLVGPANTVGHHKTGFDEWLKNFK